MYLGVKVESLQGLYLYGDNTQIGDDTGPGLLHQEIYINNKNYYEYYYIYKWNQEKCFRFRMGVKLSDKILKKGMWLQGVFVVQPYKSYWGV